MNRIHVGAACLNQTPLDWDGNHQRSVTAIAEARERRIGVYCLPELSITGYGCEDMFFAAGVRQTALEQLLALEPETHGIAAAVGLPVEVDGVVYNAQALLVDGTLVGLVCKQFMADDGIHYEPRWFRPWPRGRVERLEIAGRQFPIGDLLFDLGGVGIGFEICRDAWVADRPGRQLARRGAQVILNPSASHFAFGKQDVRRNFSLQATREFGAAFVYCNLLGNESGRAIFDGGGLIASGGEIVAYGKRFSYADHEITSATIDLDQVRQSQDELSKGQGGSKPNAQAADSQVTCPYDWPACDSAPCQPLDGRPEAVEPWELSSSIKKEEFSRAVPLALMDYLRKSHAGGFVISLSGGADSSAVAVLVAMMTRMAVEQLGVAGFRDRLRSVRALAGEEAGDTKAFLRALLVCVYQETRNSSETTRLAAEAIASDLGAEFLQWNVDAMVDGYVETVSAAVGRPLTWQNDDVPLQNVQARVRGPGVWLLANLRGALLLATSNRSEAAVGYATMDGDTCGGLSPIAGIDKAFLLEWLKWMETNGPEGFGPLPGLSVINRQRPTAELRPASAEQTDEADLMPYPVLDAVERAAIRDKLMPAEAYEVVREQFPEYGSEQTLAWVDRFFRLWRQNQWKRERYAPSFHLDDENLDPKTWCRFPILSAAYERELKQLRNG